jgi:hypothetical protein
VVAGGAAAAEEGADSFREHDVKPAKEMLNSKATIEIVPFINGPFSPSRIVSRRFETLAI